MYFQYRSRLLPPVVARMILGYTFNYMHTFKGRLSRSYHLIPTALDRAFILLLR